MESRLFNLIHPIDYDTSIVDPRMLFNGFGLSLNAGVCTKHAWTVHALLIPADKAISLKHIVPIHHQEKLHILHQGR